jgi:hypothetical protein
MKTNEDEKYFTEGYFCFAGFTKSGRHAYPVQNRSTAPIIQYTVFIVLKFKNHSLLMKTNENEKYFTNGKYGSRILYKSYYPGVF